MSDRHFRALVPNIRLQEAIGSEAIAMVPYDDLRLQKMADSDDRLRKLLDGFSDQFGRKRHPSAIISARSSAPLPGADLIDFRNAVAVSCIVGGAQCSVSVNPGVSAAGPVCLSDHFDLYPVFLPNDGKRAFLIDSHAGTGLETSIEDFRGQTSLRLHDVDAAIPAPDDYVIDALME